MLVQFLIIILVYFLVAWLLKRNSRTSQPDIKSYYNKALISAGLLVVVFLALTGRLHWLAAALFTLAAFAKKLFILSRPLLRFIPLLNRFYQQSRPKNTTKPTSPNSQKLSHKEALQILGLKEGANKDDISKQHKRLIQKVHPDRGGSDYLAERINLAKNTLLNNKL